MTAEQVRGMFPNASASTLAANAFAFQPQIVPPKEVAAVQKLRKCREPNTKEAEYGLMLEAMKRRGDIAYYAYEGISLRWGDGMRYTADFAVFPVDKSTRVRLIEIKGRDKMIRGKVTRRRDDAIVRFKGCRAEWKSYFDFEMHEKHQGQWQRID